MYFTTHRAHSFDYSQSSVINEGDVCSWPELHLRKGSHVECTSIYATSISPTPIVPAQQQVTKDFCTRTNHLDSVTLGQSKTSKLVVSKRLASHKLLDQLL